MCVLIYSRFLAQPMTQPMTQPLTASLKVLPVPGNPHWDKETGIALWEPVFESGFTDEGEAYHYLVYRRDTKEDVPNPLTDDDWENEGDMSHNLHTETPFFPMNLGSYLNRNGYYFFAVCAAGDEVNYSDSAYAVSDAFYYTGENAPYLPEPTGLAWNVSVNEETSRWQYSAIWENLDAYEDTDSFNVTVYNKEGNYVYNNIWTKENIITKGDGGIRIRPEVLTQSGEEYRFTVRALTSRPNEYRSSPEHDASEEEYLSPPYIP